MSVNIPIFYGQADENVEVWFLFLNTIFGACGLMDSDTIIYYNGSGMCDSASMWWFNKIKGKQLSDHWASWKEFQKKVVKHFHPSNYGQLLHDNLKKSRQTSSVQDYVMKFQNIAGQITDMNEADHVGFFIDELKPAIQIETKYQILKDLTITVEIASTYNSAIWDVGKVNSGKTHY